MLRTLSASALVLLMVGLAGCDREASTESIGIDPGRLTTIDLESRVFGNRRSLRVWLPPGYDLPANRERSYPVLYLNDGQNLFDSATVNTGSTEWRVDEVAAELVANGEIVPLVVVGIDNVGRRGRPREYLPWPDEYLTPPEPDPMGRHYPEFLATEVLPAIESRFRVSRDRADRALGGSSYGALIALYVALRRPDLFGRLLLESPSFYVDDRHVLRDAAETELQLDRVYLGVGTNELALENCPGHPGNAEAVQGVRDLAEILQRAGLPPGESTRVLIEECAVHDEAAWSRRLPAALAFLFPPG